jgi:hypothetical protein
MRFYLYAYWAFITPDIFNVTPFGAIYPCSPTPALESHWKYGSANLFRSYIRGVRWDRVHLVRRPLVGL